MAKTEARRIVCAIHKQAKNLRELLLQLRDRTGWKALGYDTWAACCEKEFGYSKSQANRLIKTQQVGEQVAHTCAASPNVRQSIELARLPDNQQSDCWQDYADDCDMQDTTPTAAGLREKVELYLADNVEPDLGDDEPEDYIDVEPEPEDEPPDPSARFKALIEPAIIDALEATGIAPILAAVVLENLADDLRDK